MREFPLGKRGRATKQTFCSMMPTTLHTAAPPTNVIMTASLRQDVGSASLSATANAMANLRTTRDELSDESRTSKRNHAHVTLELASVRDELGKLRAMLKADRATLATFASKIQPIIRMHELGVAQLKNVYDQAREGHARAVDVIKKEFGVRPWRPDAGMRTSPAHAQPYRAAPPPAPAPEVSNTRARQEESAALRQSPARPRRRNADDARNGAVGRDVPRERLRAAQAALSRALFVGRRSRRSVCGSACSVR